MDRRIPSRCARRPEPPGSAVFTCETLSARHNTARELPSGGLVAVRIVRLGTERLPGEGLRIGTVRRPPRGIRKCEYASKNYYDVWLPTLAPSAKLVKLALGARSDKDWNRFARNYRSELALPDQKATLDLLAALSHHATFSVGCYCADESRCHRSVLRLLLQEHYALMG